MRQRGFALLAALFLVVGLGALAAYTMRFTGTQARTLALDGLIDRAELAAAAGVEWGAYRLLRQSASCPFSQLLPALPGNLAAFSVQVQCQVTAGGRLLSVVVRHGSHPGQPDYVERSLSLTLLP
ncbi:MAG: hypothetical protein N2Z63_00930 [Thiobacillaceae bacterium]|nr:hypothetical protein [Thiobacillaceae bacterium]